MEPRPCEVLDDGVWRPGMVRQWRRDVHGSWRAFVQYRAPIRRVLFALGDNVDGLDGTYLHWRPASEVRAA